MGTKATEAANGCYAKALDDEPMFVLLARDTSAPGLVRKWADQREREGEPEQVLEGTKWVSPPHPDAAQIAEARYCAAKMEVWRYENDGSWRETATVAVTFSGADANREVEA